MWKQTCLHCWRLLKWGVQLHISHHNDFLSREFLGNNIINNQAEADCLGKHFSLSAAEYITFHSRDCDPIALLCGDSKLRGARGQESVFSSAACEHTCIQTRIWTTHHSFPSKTTAWPYHTSGLKINYTAAHLSWQEFTAVTIHTHCWP